MAFTLTILALSGLFSEGDFPPVDVLPAVQELPDPLVMFDGSRVTTARQWREQRRPELIRLFQHYMYGTTPPAPDDVQAIETSTTTCLNGQATMRQITVTFGSQDVPKIHLLLITPFGADANKPAPVFLAINFAGNHSITDDPRVHPPRTWKPNRYNSEHDNRAASANRGTRKHRWAVKMIIQRGYALATFHCGDIDPDRNDFTDGIHPHYYKPGQTKPGPHEWGTIAAWAWGLSRAVDCLQTIPSIDKNRIAVMGHSRLGKTALLAGALDERIAMVIANQSGCGGASPSRSPRGEQLSSINKNFPHWFNDTFPQFNNRLDKLPFDQNCLIAVCVPRPVLLSCAQEDQWADPLGQFEALKAAEPVYKLFDAGGCDAEEMPSLGIPVLSKLGYHIRPGKHDVKPSDWKVFLDFADWHLKKGK